MAQRLNKKLVVALTLAGAAAMMVGGVLLIVYIPAQDPGPLLAQARDLEQNGKFDEAKTVYTRAAGAARRAKPESPHYGKANEYLVLAGDMAYKGGRPGEAEAVWDAVLRDDRRNDMAQKRILDLYMERYRLYGDTYWPKVEEEARQLCDMNPEHPDPKGQRALGLALTRQRGLKPENAVEGEKLLKTVLAANKGDVEAAEYLATYYLQDAQQILNGPRPEDTYKQADARLRDAQQVYDELIANLPSDAKAAEMGWRSRGMCYMDLRNLAWNRLRLLRLGKVVAGSEAEVRAQFTEADKKALESLERAAQGDSPDEKSLWALGAYWASKPSLETDEARQKSEIEAFQAKAREAYQRAIDAAPDEFEAYAQLSKLYRQMGDVAAAADVLEKRLARGAQRGTWLERRNRVGLSALREQAFDLRLVQAAQAERESKERAELVKGLEKLCADYAAEADGGEENAGVKYMRGRLLMLNEKYAEARKLVEEANTATGGANPEIKLRLAQLYRATNAPGRAEELLREVTGSHLAASEQVWVMLAAVQLQLGNLDEARRSAERALVLNARNPEALRLLLAVYENTGNTAGAEEIRERLGIKADPKAKIVEEAVALMRTAASTQPPDAAGIEAAKAKAYEALAGDPSYYPALRLLTMILAPKDGDSPEVRARQTAELKKALDAGLAAAEKKATDATATSPALADQTGSQAGRLAARIRQLGVFTVPTTDSKEREKALEEIIKQEADPYDRAIGLADLYSGAGRTTEAVQQMKNAMEARPKDVTLVENTFTLALSKKDTWPVAEECIAKLPALGVNSASVRVHRARLALVKAEAAGQEKNMKEAQALAAMARTELEESLRESPDDPDAFAYLGQALAMLDQSDAAQQVLSKALNLNPRHRMALLLMYQLAVVRRDEAQRQVYLRKLREVWPDHVNVLREDQAAEDERNPKAAIARREKLVKDNPKDVDNLLVLAALYARTGAADKAKATYEQCRQNEPANLRVAGTYAMFLREKDPPEAATAEQLLKQVLVSLTDVKEKAKAQLMLAGHYEEMFRKSGPNAPTLADVTAAYEAAAKLDESPEVLADIAQFCARVGKLREAEVKLRQAMGLANTEPQRELNRNIHQELIRLMLSRPDDRYGEIEKEIKAYGERFSDGFAQLAHCDLALATGRMSEALEDMNAYIAKMPHDAGGYYRRGRIHYQRGAIDEAIRDLQKAESIDPRGLNFEHRQWLAQCFVAKGQPDVAIAQLNAIIREDPNPAGAVTQLMSLYESQGQWAAAEALALPRARDLNDRDRWGWLSRLANLYSRQGDTSRAIQAAREAVEAGKYRATLLDMYAGLCVRGKQPRAFIDFVEQNVPAETRQQSSVQLRLAEAQAAAKEVAKSLELYDQLLAAAKGDLGRVLSIASSMNTAVGKEGAAWVQKRLAAKPDDRALRFALGVLQLQGGDYEGGMKALEALLGETTGTDDRAKAEQTTILRLMSVNAHTRQEVKRAREWYERLLALDPTDTTASNNLAYLLMTEFKDLPKARALAESAVRNMSPAASSQDRAVLLDTLGWSLVQTGDLDAGIARLQQAARLAQSGTPALDYVVAGIYYHAAEAYFRRSQVEGNRNAESDRGEAALTCQRAWQLLKTADPADPDRMRETLQTLAGKLQIALEETAPASQPGKTS